MSNTVRYKVILLGNIDVGKTSIIVRFTDGTFDEDFKGEIDQKSKTIEHEGKTAKMIITDTAGQERFRTLTSSYYRNADAIIVVYDVTDRESFTDVEGHLTEGTRYSARSEKFLVANKMDLSDTAKVSDEEGEKLATKYKVKFIKTSAKTGDGVAQLFEAVASCLLSAQPAQANSVQPVDLHAPRSKPSKGKCVIV